MYPKAGATPVYDFALIGLDGVVPDPLGLLEHVNSEFFSSQSCGAAEF